jgi:hypothetical protein
MKFSSFRLSFTFVFVVCHKFSFFFSLFVLLLSFLAHVRVRVHTRTFDADRNERVRTFLFAFLFRTNERTKRRKRERYTHEANTHSHSRSIDVMQMTSIIDNELLRSTTRRNCSRRVYSCCNSIVVYRRPTPNSRVFVLSLSCPFTSMNLSQLRSTRLFTSILFVRFRFRFLFLSLDLCVLSICSQVFQSISTVPIHSYMTIIVERCVMSIVRVCVCRSYDWHRRRLVVSYLTKMKQIAFASLIRICSSIDIEESFRIHSIDSTRTHRVVCQFDVRPVDVIDCIHAIYHTTTST